MKIVVGDMRWIMMKRFIWSIRQNFAFFAFAFVAFGHTFF